MATRTAMPTEAAVPDTALLRLLQLASVSLPVGGYAFSQGLEYAIETGAIGRRADVYEALALQLTESLAQVDLPILERALEAATRNDPATLGELNDLALACRETRELRLTDTAMGAALNRLLRSLGVEVPFATQETVSFVTAFACAAAQWQIPFRTTALGFAWAWLENQVAAATKLVPLGQTDAQILLGELQPLIPDAIDHARGVADDAIGACLPALAIYSAQHETQYSRLFRS